MSGGGSAGGASGASGGIGTDVASDFGKPWSSWLPSRSTATESKEHWEFWLYVLYDAGDAFFDNAERETQVALSQNVPRLTD